jgi:hypothetical protein
VSERPSNQSLTNLFVSDGFMADGLEEGRPTGLMTSNAETRFVRTDRSERKTRESKKRVAG